MTQPKPCPCGEPKAATDLVCPWCFAQSPFYLRNKYIHGRARDKGKAKADLLRLALGRRKG